MCIRRIEKTGRNPKRSQLLSKMSFSTVYSHDARNGRAMRDGIRNDMELHRILEQIIEAHKVLRDYDGSTVTAIAEIWAQINLGMVKADKGDKGIDGILPNGRTLQIKSKKSDAHRDSQTFFTLSKGTLELADDVLIVFVDYDTCNVNRIIGPVAIADLKPRNKGRYFISDLMFIEDNGERVFVRKI